MQPPSTPTRPTRGSRTGATSMATRQSQGPGRSSSSSTAPGQNSRADESDLNNGSMDNYEYEMECDSQSFLVTPQTVTKFKQINSAQQVSQNTTTTTTTPENFIMSPNFRSVQKNIFMDNGNKVAWAKGNKRQYMGTATPGLYTETAKDENKEDEEEDARDVLMSKLLTRSPEYTPQKQLRTSTFNTQQGTQNQLIQGQIAKKKLDFKSMPSLHPKDNKNQGKFMNIFESDEEDNDVTSDLEFEEDNQLKLAFPVSFKKETSGPSTPTSKVVSFEQAEQWHNMSRLDKNGKLRNEDTEDNEVFVTKKILKNPFLSDDSPVKATQPSIENDDDSEEEQQRLKDIIYKK